MKYLLFTLLLSFYIANSQNKELIKETLTNFKSNEFDKIAFDNGYKDKEILKLNPSFKLDSLGNIFEIQLNKKSKIFEPVINNIINKIPQLDKNEYLSKGKEMKYGIKLNIKTSSRKKLEKRIKNNILENIDLKWIYIKQYFPVKKIKIDSIENKEILKNSTAPFTKNCKGITDRRLSLNCLNREILSHVQRTFDTSLAEEIGMKQSIQKVLITFWISKKGEIVNIESKASRKELSEEGIRVINSYDEPLSPATYNGQPIDTKYTIPITFSVN